MRKLLLLTMLLVSCITMAHGQRKYAIGDIYREGSVVGIVVQVTDDGAHGLLMSLDEGEANWSLKPHGGLFDIVTGFTDYDDGRKNMEKLVCLINKMDFSWDHFPAFRWCRNKGEGWCLPAINELITINKAIHGGKLEKNKEARKRFNKILENNGGKKIGRYNVYFSSTEKDEMKAYAIYFESGILGYGTSNHKRYRDYVRAVYGF